MTADITALIPAAGLGTRMIPATKELPKEMLPVPSNGPGSSLVFKPFIQLVYEALYNAGIRVFAFVVGRGKRILQDHFVVDNGLLVELRSRGKMKEASALEEFYGMLEDSTIIWVDQPEPRGLGDAVKRGLKAVSTEAVLVHLGDILLHSNNGSPLERLIQSFKTLERCDALLALVEVENPKKYGVAVPGSELIDDVYEVTEVIEKPEEPPSNLAISGVYVFKSDPIRAALEEAGINPRTGEHELTDAIQILTRKGRVCGYTVKGANYIDIGRPESYMETLRSLGGGVSGW
ncbi:MAG: NTP transferase domain-containing protein [Desulfurococcales archaeon]|nr:NTP transferase domain-containing protein [Desulfurococcales archaeon]